jgi:putative salt-induced outer membrane protein YdiY
MHGNLLAPNLTWQIEHNGKRTATMILLRIVTTTGQNHWINMMMTQVAIMRISWREAYHSQPGRLLMKTG